MLLKLSGNFTKNFIKATISIILPVVFGLAFSIACYSALKPEISLSLQETLPFLLALVAIIPLHLVSWGFQDENPARNFNGLAYPVSIASMATIGSFAALFIFKTEIAREFAILGTIAVAATSLFSLVPAMQLTGLRPGSLAAGKWLEKAVLENPGKNPYLVLPVILLTPGFLYFAQFIEPGNVITGMGSLHDFILFALLSSLAGFLIILVAYGRMELALSASLPVVVFWVWIAGLMGFFHLRLNTGHIFMSILLAGTGNYYAVMTLEALCNGYRTGKKQMKSTRLGILLSAITILAVSVLTFIPANPAIRSAILISFPGIFSLLLMTQVLEPFLFNIFVNGPVDRGFAPVSFSTLLKSVLAYTFFILGCLFLSISGIILLGINPFYRKRAKILFNFLISLNTRAQIYVMINVTKRVVLAEKPDYSKPAVFVANHQSVLDILSMIMLSPRIILLTNRWVWNSPLFGYVVRFAGYYPIFEGADPGIEILKSKVEEGYSIAIFPEGTRSRHGEIGRFHKGAFYLAHKLELDIIPVIFHDTCECIAKGSFIVRDTTFTIKILPRIRFSDPGFGTSYQQTTKKIHEMFRREYALLDEEMHHPAYYRDKLSGNFLFKGILPEIQMKVNLWMENNYQLFHRLAPAKGVIIVADCGYGFMAWMLAWMAPGREVIGLDDDRVKIEIAGSGYERPSNLRFVSAEAADYATTTASCVIFNEGLDGIKRNTRVHAFTGCASRLQPGGSIIIRTGSRNFYSVHITRRLRGFPAPPVSGFTKKKVNGVPVEADDLICLGKNLGFEFSRHAQERTSDQIIVFKK
ncbi:MAG: 1-acyl-sn-glycerol-3-phosphate acyltransferase [Bacteroidota bacterium]